MREPIYFPDSGEFTTVAGEAIFDVTLGGEPLAIEQSGTLRVTFLNGDTAGSLSITGLVTGDQLLGGGPVAADSPLAVSGLEVRASDQIDFKFSAASAGARLLVSMVVGGVI